MKKIIFFLLVVVLVVAFTPQSASAGDVYLAKDDQVMLVSLTDLGLIIYTYLALAYLEYRSIPANDVNPNSNICHIREVVGKYCPDLSQLALEINCPCSKKIIICRSSQGLFFQLRRIISEIAID